MHTFFAEAVPTLVPRKAIYEELLRLQWDQWGLFSLYTSIACSCTWSTGVTENRRLILGTTTSSTLHVLQVHKKRLKLF